LKDACNSLSFFRDDSFARPTSLTCASQPEISSTSKDSAFLSHTSRNAYSMPEKIASLDVNRFKGLHVLVDVVHVNIITLKNLQNSKRVFKDKLVYLAMNPNPMLLIEAHPDRLRAFMLCIDARL
jgi:hypothetical protein